MKSKLALSLTWVLLVLVGYFTVFSSATHAFEEEFTNGLDNPSAWFISNSTGIQYLENSVSFSSHFSSFPYIDTQSNVVENHAVEVRFRFLRAGSAYGSGFAFTDNVPPYPYPGYGVMSFPSDFVEYTVFYVWHDRTPSAYNLHLGTSLCPAEESGCLENIRFFYKTETPDYSWHVVKVVPTNYLSYDFYFDGELVFRSASTVRKVGRIWIGHPSVLVANDWTSFELDYIKSYPVNSFPYYSQLDEEWAGEEYDHASRWAAEGKRGIGEWGCALTSAAMLLKQFEVKTTAGEESTPERLNNWLTTQGDGYLPNGLLNWLAVARYSREAYEAGQAPKMLEYSRSSYEATSLELPSVLGEPGHFVAAYGEDGEDWLVHDPLAGQEQRRAKSTGFTSVNTYLQSKTDLSYLLFMAEEQTPITLVDEAGSAVGKQYLEEPIESGEQKSGTPLQAIYYPKPASGLYKLSTGAGKVWLYWYDEGGSFQQFEAECPRECEYSLQFEKKDSGAGSVSVVVHESFPELVWRLESEGRIKGRWTRPTILRYYQILERVPAKYEKFRARVKQALTMYIRGGMWWRKIEWSAGEELLSKLAQE